MALTGVLALLLAAVSAIWLLFQMSARPDETNTRRINILKIAAWFGLAAALFAAKLTPIAIMILIAAGGVTAIEVWRERRIDEDQVDDIGLGNGSETFQVADAISEVEEAAALLDIATDADESEIKSAHRKLISQLHPDAGGNDYLAAKINGARDLLLKRAEEQSPSDQP